LRVLYTTPILEYPAAGGPQLRIENSIKALSRVCLLDIIHRAPYPSSDVEATSSFFQQYAENYHTLYDYPKSRVARIGMRVLRRAFGKLGDSHSTQIIDHIRKNKIDVVWFGYGNISYPLIQVIKEQLPGIKVVCDTDSVWSRFVLRELPFAKGPRASEIQKAGALKEAEERAWVNLCEVTTAVSEVDAEYYRSIAKYPHRIRLFSNVIDIHNYAAVPDAPKGFNTPCMFLAGSYGPNSAMNMAAEWILDEVLPIVRESYPNVHFYLVGRNSDREFGNRSGPNVTVTGKLESVLPYLCHADVALVPLKFESGTRFKILEAGACRIPIVSTTLGAEGIPVRDGENILIADDPHEFAMAIMKILGEPTVGKALADSCYELVRAHYSVQSLELEAINILEYLADD